MGATTDSEMLVKYDVVNKPGISNLINIYSSLTGKTIEEVENEFVGKNYGEFKKCVADEVEALLTNVQEKYKEYINSNLIDEVLDIGRNKTLKEAEKKYNEIKDKVGFKR